MSTALYRLGRFAARRPWTVLGIWFVIAAIVIVSSATGGKEFEDTFTVPGLDSDEALVLLEEAQSDEAGVSAQIVVASTDADSTIVEQPSQVEAVRADFASLDDIIGVTPAQFSPDGTVALLRVLYPPTAQLSVETLEDLKELQAELDGSNDLQIEASGELFFTFEEPETGTGEMIGIVAAIIILLVAFGSVIAMGLPIGTALFGLALGVSAMGLINYLLDIPSWAPQMAAMVGIGVGIDYALFLVTRHREYLSKGMTVEESVGRAVATAGQAVIFAGGTVVIAILGLAVAGIPFMTAAGVATSLVVLIMVVAAVTLLPAFLGVAGHKINGIRASRRRVINPGISPRWEAWGAHVSRHAWKYAVGVTAGLLMLSAPVLALQLGFPDDGNLPEDRTERQAFDLTTEAFGVGFSGPLLIAVDTGGDTELISQLATAVEADDNIAAVQASSPAAGSDVATLLAYPYTSPQDAETYATVQRLRADVFSTVVGADQRAHIGGQTASFGDVGNQIEQRLPWFISAVVFLSFFLLTGVFRSPIVALKAAILNLFDRRCLRRARHGVPVGLGHRAPRPARDGADRLVYSDVHVRDLVRTFDGLRGVPAQPGARGVRPVGQQRPVGHPRHRLDRPRDYLRSADHDLGLRWFRARPRPCDQDGRSGIGHSDLRRRHDRSYHPRPCDDEADGRLQLVDPGVARSADPRDRHRG